VSELLRDHTTLRLGGPADHWVVATTEAELVDAVQAADNANRPLLLLGGGSNLVVADAGFQGEVVQIATGGVKVDADEPDTLACCGGVLVTAAAGENWDNLVSQAVTNNWVGLEALSGIPGKVGATPIQNVGAYGQEVADTIASVRTWDRATSQQATFPAGDCRFSYRSSRFKAEPERYVVLEVTFQLKQGTLSAPIKYAELARAVGVEVGDRAPLEVVRWEVLRLRANKGMLLDAVDHDSWSAGSFFTNPILSAEQATSLPANAPRWPQADGTVKTSAAWLIEQAGFGKGYGLGEVSLSTKHSLALTNRGRGTTSELLKLAAEIRTGVSGAFGVALEPEPQLINCSL
jgi:UDP-N-acetylmuramate dehydrogenase